MQQETEHNITPRILWITMLIFGVVSAIGICNHVLWTDEAQHFLLARDSDSITHLFYNMRYDGHVRLWNVLLFFITHYISGSPLGMQLFHLTIICSCVFVFLRYAPFDTITKLLIIFGYYFIFEYNVISRNYSLGILFLFITCTLLGRRGTDNLFWLGLLLLLMCETHLFFAFAATGIMIYVWYTRWPQKNFDLQFYGLLAIYCAAIVTVVIQTSVPPDDIFLHPGQLSVHSLVQLHPAVYAFVKGLMPVPVSIKGNFWGNYYIDSLPRFLKASLAVIFFVYPFLLLRKRISAMWFYYSSVFLMLLFVCLSPIDPSPRYYGMVFIFFIAAAWLAGNESTNIFSIERILHGNLKTKLFYGFFYCILMGNLFCGVYACAKTYSRPFTGAKQAARYIKANQPASEMTVVAGYWPGPALSAYLGTEVFYLNINKPGSYLYWKTSYFEFLFRPFSQQLSQPGYLAARNHFLFVWDQPLRSYQVASGNYIFQFTPLDSFTRVVGMPYYIYRLDRKINPVPVSGTKTNE